MLPTARFAVHTCLAQWRRDEEGADMVEYALLLGLMTLGTIATVVLVGPSISQMFSYITGTLQTYL